MRIPAYTPAPASRRGFWQRLGDRARRRGITPRDRKVAGFAVYLAVVWFVMFGIDQRAVVKMLSIFDSPPQGVTTDSPMRFERGRYLPSGDP